MNVVTAWAWIDSDHAVELYLKFREEEEGSVPLGLGLLAINEYLNTPLIRHPKIQALFVQDGKWIDYLAERFPEYVPHKSAKK